MLAANNRNGFKGWLSRNLNLTMISAQLAIMAVAFALFKWLVLDNYAEAFDDSHPHTMLVCRAKQENDFSHCAPHTLAFKSAAACARAGEEVFFGVKSISHIFPSKPSVDGKSYDVDIPVIITCVPSDQYRALEPDKVSKEVQGLPMHPLAKPTCSDDEHCPFKPAQGNGEDVGPKSAPPLEPCADHAGNCPWKPREDGGPQSAPPPLPERPER